MSIWNEPVHCDHCGKYIELHATIYTRIKPYNGQDNNKPIEYDNYHEECAIYLGLITKIKR